MSIEVMTWAWKLTGLKPTEKLVLMKLADCANDEGVCWPGKARISEECCVAKRTVDAAINSLVERRLVRVRRRKSEDNPRVNDVNVYLIANRQPGGLWGGADSALPQNLQGCNSQQGVVQTVRGGGAAAAPKPSLNRHEPPDLSSAGAEGRVYESAKGKKLTGSKLERFERFWDAFDHKHGKAEAADAWLKVDQLIMLGSLDLDRVLQAARAEAVLAAKDSTRTRKMAQGWLTGRRWEDFEPEAPAGQKRAPAREREWFETWQGILDRGVERYGVSAFEHDEPVAFVGALVRAMEGAGDAVPADLLAYRNQLETRAG